MTVNLNTLKLPLDADRRSLIKAALSDRFNEIGDEDSADECTALSDEELVKWAREEFGSDDSFWEDDDGNLIEEA